LRQKLTVSQQNATGEQWAGPIHICINLWSERNSAIIGNTIFSSKKSSRLDLTSIIRVV